MQPSNYVTYQNPVYPHTCPDPFVLKFCGEYWCYYTGRQPDGGVIGILRSLDLVHWSQAGSALKPQADLGPYYWAPEVVYDNGRFYMYYSVGNEETMHIRVAVAGQPQGPFMDSGRRLTREEFAIDGHVFADEDGKRYLFYATDYLDYSHIGTGTAVDRLLDPFTLEGRPHPVTRARYDWQVFDPQRAAKGGVRWHTLEGPFVLKRQDTYYQMFSGGNYTNDTYGVGYAVTSRIDSQDEWEQVCDGVATLPVLRTQPDLGVIGPGHNSVVRGPDNRTLVCVYHRWQPETDERVLAIDPLGWEGERLVIYGPSTEPQALRLPDVWELSGLQGPAPGWQVWGGVGRLLPGNQDAHSHEGGARIKLAQLEFTLEASFRFPEPLAGSSFFVDLEDSMQAAFRAGVAFNGSSSTVTISSPGGQAVLPLPGYDPSSWHLLRLDVQAGRVTLTFDGDLLGGWKRAYWEGEVGAAAQTLRFSARGGVIEITGFSLAWGGPTIPG